MSGNNAAHLPPKPDASTGEPRPPRAPIHGKSSDRAHSRTALTPRPPRNCGPTLESYVVSNTTAWSGGISMIVLFVVFFTIFYGLSWMSIWWTWLLILGSAGAIVFTIHGTFCAAGADWLRTRNGWVNTYELTKIEMHLNGTSLDLFLKDSSGRGTNNQIADLQANRKLWDLVYNGLKHSVVNGAQVNGYARGALNLGEKS